MSSLLGGLALFLYSIKKLGDGIRGAFGGELKASLPPPPSPLLL
jgi:Na+/phosphate symporter